MPIIINEFEIITEPPPASPEQAQRPQRLDQQPPALRPADIIRIQWRHRQRMARIRAT